MLRIANATKKTVVAWSWGGGSMLMDAGVFGKTTNSVTGLGTI